MNLIGISSIQEIKDRDAELRRGSVFLISVEASESKN